MKRGIYGSVAFVALLRCLCASPPLPQGPVVKIRAERPVPRRNRVDHGPEAIASTFTGPLASTATRPQQWVSASPVPPYMIQFHVELPRDGVRMMYVVYFAWDYRERRASSDFPGPRDAWYTLNMSTVALPTSGKWFYATEEWGSAVEPALFARRTTRWPGDAARRMAAPAFERGRDSRSR